MIKIKFYIYDKITIAPLEKLLHRYCKEHDIKYSLVPLPKKNKKFTFLKAPHINKKAKEHFILTTRKRIFTLNKVTLKVLLPLLKKIPNNVAYKVTVIGSF